jgi:hypothetical protein
MLKGHPGKTPDVFDEIEEDDVLTAWEHDFLAEVGAQDYPLTDAQEAKLAEIEAAIPERMELARQGRWPVYRRR